MGTQRRAALAALFITLLCSASTIEALDIKGTVKDWIVRNVDWLVEQVATHGIDGLSQLIAAALEEEGQPEAAAAVREVADVIEEAVKMFVDGAACYASTSSAATTGMSIGCTLLSALGCAAGFVVGAVASLVNNPSCQDTVEHLAETWEQADEAIDALESATDGNTPAITTYSAWVCGGNSFATANAANCIFACEDKVPKSACFNAYYSHGCCLCKVAPCKSSSTSDTSSSSSSQKPTADGSGSCGSLEYDVDFHGGDIVPVSTKWADTAVEASSPEDCCEACSLYSFCGAWTFTPPENCKDRFPGAPGCCYLKKGTGYEKRSAPGMVSGTSGGAPVATCTLEFDTNFKGGDIQTGTGPDTVVQTISDADCCTSCAAVPGCGAWTMAPHSECADRLPHARGCCFLKHEGGWTRTKDDKGVLTSGQLL